jgi:hypothetical protein
MESIKRADWSHQQKARSTWWPAGMVLESDTITRRELSALVEVRENVGDIEECSRTIFVELRDATCCNIASRLVLCG